MTAVQGMVYSNMDERIDWYKKMLLSTYLSESELRLAQHGLAFVAPEADRGVHQMTSCSTRVSTLQGCFQPSQVVL